jgi:hypothetical protein
MLISASDVTKAGLNNKIHVNDDDDMNMNPILEILTIYHQVQE